MTDLDEQGRPEPPLAADEAATLVGFLEYQRATLAWKCAGVDAAGLRATVAASSMTLGGLLKHLAYVEADWFSRCCMGGTGNPRVTAWTGRPTPTGSGTRPRRTPPSSCSRSGRTPWPGSRALVAEALADGGLARPARRSWPDGRAPSLRWILCHLIEEYARHNGHADLLRESVDGLTGE
jgi:Protein of unknown function (DUF664)